MEEELKCPLCLDFFIPPVRITTCGHNYCQECLTMFTEIPWRCPVDQIEQQQSPEQLTRNYFLERTLENFNESRGNICATHNLPKRLRKYSHLYHSLWCSLFWGLITKIINKFSDCLKHDRSLCHECVHVGMCNGQAASECDVMNLTEFKTTLNDRLTKLNDQFSTLNHILEAKREAFIELYRTDPRISHDQSILCLQTAIEAQRT